MTTPRRSHHGSSLWRDGRAAGVSSSSAASSPLSRSLSTPQRLYEASRERANGSRLSLASSSSPFLAQSIHDSPTSFQGSASRDLAGTPARRKNTSLGSPGIRALSNAASQTAIAGGGTSSRQVRETNTESDAIASTPTRRPTGRKSAAFIRRKTVRQKLFDLPSDIYEHLTTTVQSIEESLMDPALGYPLGLALHAASLLSHLISPESDLSISLLTGVDADMSGGRESLFAAGGTARRRGGARRYIESSKAAARSWTAALFSTALVVLSLFLAYNLVKARKRYRLWMRDPESKVRSRNARLVSVDLDEDDEYDGSRPTLQERITEMTLRALIRVPGLSLLLPRLPRRSQSAGQSRLRDARMHELSIWEPNVVVLRMMTVYSPLHALSWHIAGSSLWPVSTFLGWVTFFCLQVALAGQLALLATLFADLVKDRALLAAEVLHEYDEKFVLPRAMPSVRDACVMTSQAEMVTPSDWQR
ncbi:unnamed protein product [Parajaminaea phylloscopi]